MIYESDSGAAWEQTRTQDWSLYVSDSGVKPLADVLAAAFSGFTYDEEALVYRGEVTVEGTALAFVVCVVGGRVVQVDWTQEGVPCSLSLQYGGQEVNFPFDTE